MQKVFYASFDEVPSFKGASTHILANCRAILRHFELTLVTLGDNPLPSITHGHFKHIPLGISHTNYLIRGKKFRQSPQKPFSKRVA